VPYSALYLHSAPRLLYVFAYTAIYRFLPATSSKPSKAPSKRSRLSRMQRPIRKTVPSSSCSVSRVLQHDLFVSAWRCRDHRATQRPVVCTRTTRTCPTKRTDKGRGTGNFSALHGGSSVAQKQCLRCQPSQVKQWSGRRPSRPWSRSEALRDESNTRSSRSSAPASVSIRARHRNSTYRLCPPLMYAVESGSTGQNERILTFISGSVTYVIDSISNHCRVKIDKYIQDLLKLGPHIVHSQLVNDFFAARLGDCEAEL
jgi:hypothetical protein